MGTIHAGERWGGGAGATKFTTVAALSHRVGGRAGGGQSAGGGGLRLQRAKLPLHRLRANRVRHKPQLTGCFPALAGVS